MPTLRLFAQAREAAGAASVDLPGATVDEVLAAAVDRFGATFAAVLAEAKVWCNGEPTTLAAVVVDTDEIAVIPPVSGGAA
jgi:molybdopterin synthase sulfur carrier subunit